MSSNFTFKELTILSEMQTSYTCILEMYPNMTATEYTELLKNMIPNNYTQLAVLDNEEIIAVCGIWINTKLWCGKYIELDNVIVKEHYRSLGIGKLITSYLNKKAKDLNCNIMALDAYTNNKRAHKFYINDGYEITGFHFIKKI